MTGPQRRVRAHAAMAAGICIALSLCPGGCGQGVSFGVDSIGHCVGQGLFFDPARLACGSCGSNQQVAPSGVQCECDSNSIVTSTTVRSPRGAVILTCTPCGTNETVSFDGLSCVTCPGGVCTCATGEVSRTRNATSTLSEVGCLSCGAGYGSGGDQRCLPCAYSDMAAGCGTCPTGTTSQGLDCISNSVSISPPVATAFNVDFSGVGAGTIDSTLFRERLPGAYINCLDTLGTNRTACQLLANLCALQLYADNLGSQTACTLYKQVVALNSTNRHGFPGWPLALPWLYYDADSFPAAATDVQLEGLFDHSEARSTNQVSRLEFVVHAHFLNGSFAGVQPVTSQFELCLPAPRRIGLAWQFFGTTFERSCTIELNNSALFDTNLPFSEPLFYEPYLVDYDPSGAALLYPVPVKIDGVAQFVRRYFLFDNVSSVGQSPPAVRIATSVSLEIKFQDGGNGRIFPPVLQVGYSSFDGSSSQTVPSAFSVTYTDDHDDFTATLEVVITVMGCVSVILAYIRSRADRERDRRDDGGLRMLTSFAYEWTRYFSTSLYMVLGGAGLYFVFLGNQGSGAYTTPPNDEQDDAFERWLIIGASFKIIQACYIVFQQSKYDYFLIDWEDDSVTKSEPSIWRTLFIANELQELGAVRKVPYNFLVLSVLFWWSIAGAENLASQNPRSDEHDYDGGDNSILRFGVAFMLFTTMYVGMWLFHKVIYVRLINDVYGSFQDLCSLSNISVIVFTHDCRGWYLHGMSPHGPAEVGLMKMTQQLEEEAEDLGKRRGLVENTDDQVFEIHIQESVRKEYMQLLDEVTQAERQGGRGTTWRVNPKAMSQYSKMNRFFKAYLTHSFRDKDWIVREKTNMERWTSTTPAVANTAVFFPDKYGGMAEIFILGQEGAIFIFEFFVFALTDWFAQSFVGAAVATVVCTIIIHSSRLSLGKDNLAKKTLVNKCFLI